jgi:hypothetical protein
VKKSAEREAWKMRYNELYCLKPLRYRYSQPVKHQILKLKASAIEA